VTESRPLRTILARLLVVLVLSIAAYGVLSMLFEPSPQQLSTCGGMMHTRADGTQFCGPIVTPTKVPAHRATPPAVAP
jgi:hypothetical protein